MDPAKQGARYQTKGFTLVELLVAMLIASITVTAGLKLSQTVVDNSRKSQRNQESIRLADSTIDQIQQEIRNGEELIDAESDLPTGCDGYKSSGISFLFAVDIPDQAMSLADYDISQGAPKLTAVKCPIIYGTRSTSTGKTLYRIGPEINDKGYYIPTADSTSVMLEGIHTTPSTSAHQQSLKQQCQTPKWKYLEQGGIAACIDQRMKRMAKLAITMKPEAGTTATAASTQRQGGAMTQVMRSDALATGTASSPEKCKSGSGCNFGGQPISCDKTSFLIDVSGSMGWYGDLEKAKQELLRAIDSCSDEAEINVWYFGSGGASFFTKPEKLNQANRDFLRVKINGLRAGGGTYPFRHITSMVNDNNVKEIVVLSDGVASESSSGTTYLGGVRRYGAYADAYAQHNATGRKDNPVKIKTISFGWGGRNGNLCGSGWMGAIADRNGGSCIVAR